MPKGRALDALRGRRRRGTGAVGDLNEVKRTKDCGGPLNEISCTRTFRQRLSSERGGGETIRVSAGDMSPH